MVSIITPCYNAGIYIYDTIESVLNQTFRDWELIIVDDSSLDNSASIIKEFTRKDNRIKYFKTDTPSGSPAKPRNIGIEYSQGEYIAFLDADDLWFPEKLEKQVNFMNDNKFDLSYSYYEKINWNGDRNDRIVKTASKTDYRSLLKSNSIPCLTSMIRRSIIGDVRFRKIPQEDFCFWLDILKKGYTAYNICQVTALYREAKSSRSSNKLDMFKGYWNVIRKYQKVPFLQCCYYMMTYSIQGLTKYLK